MMLLELVVAATLMPAIGAWTALGWCVMLEEHPWLKPLERLLLLAPEVIGNPLGLCWPCTTLVFSAVNAVLFLPVDGWALVHLTLISAVSGYAIAWWLETEV